MTQELLLGPGLQNGTSGLPFRRLNFVPAQRPDAHTSAPNDSLVPLNAEMPSAIAPREAGRASKQHSLVAVKPFCHESSIQLQWGSPRKAGVGLVNLGNTCFMNSVLQALTHTAPLAELCLHGQNLSNSTEGNQHLDPIAATQAHIRRALTSHTAVQPKWHARNLKTINRRFRLGRQEDAHEYLRCVLDAMHEAFLKPIKPKPPPELAATTFVHRIFGGKLRSQITCEGVDYISSTFDPFLDLSLEINKANSITRALQHFTANEVLDGDNRYRCPKNNKLVRAHKRISIDVAPTVLTVHLKRFDFLGRGHKLSKRVEFGMELDLGPFMTQHLHRHHHHHHKHHQHKHGQQHHHHHGAHTPLMYDLYAVLVHMGHSLHSGHYVCYVKAGNGTWYLCDDHRVAQVGQRSVEGQQAYILFYIKRQSKGAAGALPAAVAAAAQNAAVAANRSQQQQQQHLAGSDSTKTPAAGAVAALARGRVPAAAGLVGEQQQQGKPLEAGQSGSASAAEEIRKVVTSSTESTANASPVGTQLRRSPDAVDSGAAEPAFKAAANHAHHHHLRTRPPLLTKFERHMQLHHELAHAKLSRMHHKRLKAAAAAVHKAANGLAQQQQPQQRQAGQQQGSIFSAPASAGTPGVIDLGLIGSKRRRQEQQQPEQPEQKQQPAPQGLQQAGDKQGQLSKQKRLEAATERPQLAEQPEQQQAVQQQQGDGALEERRAKRSKASDHNSGQAAAMQPVQQRQQEEEDSLPQRPKQQQIKQQHSAGAATDGKVAVKPAARRNESAAVTGAAALDLVMGAAGASSSSLVTWDGGDELLAAKAAALQQQAAAQQKRKQRDEWDADYDRGKVKKVKKKKADAAADGDDEAADAGGNRFQQAWQQQLPQKARNEAWKGEKQQGSSRDRPGRGRGFGRGSGGGRGRGGGRGGSRGGFGSGRGRGPPRGRGGGGRGGRGARGGGGRGRGRGGGFQRQQQ